jgi:SET and MYND domain-containing protein
MCIWSAEGRIIGRCLDVVGSLMNHSCDANAFVYHEGNELRVRSLKPIRAGEEITQNYGDDDEDVLPRRNRLQEKYFFLCECARDLSGIIMTRC